MYHKYSNVEYVKPSGLELQDHLVAVQRVTKVTKGGRTFGFSAIVVVGDGESIVGHGLGKSKDVATSIAKGIENAKKNLVRIPITKRTLPHEQKGKYGGARVNIIPAAPGTGVIAGGPVRAVLELAGLQDVRAKSLGSNNPNNMVAATINGLLAMKTIEQVAKARGLSPEEILG